MKISVIVPVYNRLEHFRALFICLLKQNRQIDELIITDDGSSQKILDYIGDLIPKASFKIKHIYQEDKGFRKTRALNNGVVNSEGELLVFCDQDLIFGEEYIEYMEKNIKKGYFLLCRPVSINEEEKNIILKKIENTNKYEELLKPLPKCYLEGVNKTLDTDRKRRILNILKLAKRGIKLVGMSYAVLKRDYMKVNGYDENYNGWGEEDDDFGNRLYVAGIKGKELKTPNMQIHLWHYSDPTKKHSMNEEYYYKRKKEIFSNKDYFCKNGCSEARDDVKVTILN
ncbi:glycosyltransferase [Fusobacterium simiae]|uniref:Glycosyltransferase n=1 Tax=Fusobacterium simiae TaxID=855 RepID=A0ABT4DJT6_FUSSI|nr:glycosyltransferase [Fusobacterium simiae]MCY7008857.1 glycosyltransferase [Fusobacterium simiae]